MYYKRKQTSTIQIGHKFQIIYDIIQAMKHFAWPNWVKIEVLPYEDLYIISYAEFNGESISGLIKVKSSSVWSIKFFWNLYWKDTTKYNFLCLSYSSILPFLHIMIIRNPFLTIGQNETTQDFSIFIQSRYTEGGFTIRFHALHQNPFSTISLGCFHHLPITTKNPFFYFNMKMKDCNDLIT